MKTNFSSYNQLLSLKLIILIVILSQIKIAFGQNQTDSNIDKNIDPRQYVTVLYRKTPTTGKVNTIWKWENSNFIPNQKFTYLDINGDIKISFDKRGLNENEDMEGTFSLEAEISGPNGTRNIEVNPYSEIGIQRTPIGIKSEPPYVIAQKLLNLIYELKDAEDKYDSLLPIKGSYIFNYNAWKLMQDSRKTYEQLTDIANSGNVKLDYLREKCLDLQTSINYGYWGGDTLINITSNIKSITDLKEKFIDMWSIYENSYNYEKGKMEKKYIDALNYEKEKIQIVLEYLNSFEAGGEDATKAFLSLLNKDLVLYTNNKNQLVTAQKELINISVDFRENDPKLDSVLLVNQNIIEESLRHLLALSHFNGSALERIVKSFQTNPYSDDAVTFNQKQFATIKTNLIEISNRLSKEAGKIIYKKLVYAIIDLGKSGAKPGEVLNIYVTWILDSKKDSSSNSPRLPIGKYYLFETGWKAEVTDMFALVKRIHESKVNQSTVSPSNFKGSGGAVLNWTYLKEDKGLKLSSNNVYIKRNKFINFLEPSIGFNVSYLDFSTEKDVEIGTGLQVGIFRNKIFFGYGVNLNLLSPKGQAPSYYYIGFSFAKLADLFKNGSSVTSQQ